MCGLCQDAGAAGRIAARPEEDVPAGARTDAVLRAGQTLSGHLDPGDSDWIRLRVAEGETFVLTTADGPGASASDTILVLRDRAGAVVAIDDDSGPGLHARLSHVAEDTVYYAEVTTYLAHYGYGTEDSGSFTLSLAGADTTPAEARPVWSTAHIARQLARDYWIDSGEAPRSFDRAPATGDDAPIHVDLSGLDAAGRWLARHALDAWTAVSGLDFTTAPPPSGEPVGIRFEDEGSGAYTSLTLSEDGTILNAFVTVSRGWIKGDEGRLDSYGFQTYLHEIGHALGLGHPGAYNQGTGVSLSYARHAEFANDSWQASVMSYFSQAENTEIDGSRAYRLTPSAADILAIQRLYGRAEDLRPGDTVYGPGSTAGDHFDALDRQWKATAFTIVDSGGRDTLDLRGTSADQRVSLAPDSLSDVGGGIGTLSIAVGTILENALLGGGDDRAVGNAAANRLAGGRGGDTLDGAGGRDRISGQGGADDLAGGGGADRLAGGRGADRLDGGGGRDLLRGGGGADIFVFGPGGGRDRIADWHDGVDRLDLRGWHFDSAAEVRATAQDHDGGLRLAMEDGGVLTIDGLALAEFGAADLIL